MTSKDLDWPTMAQGDFALIITEKGQSTNYCLMFPSRLIYSYDNSRPGALNIQLQLPHGKVFVDAAGKMVSPFTLLQELFNHYKQHHLTQYQYRGKEVWKFRSDWEMTQAEFDELLAPYTLTDHVLPNRHLNGTGEAFIAMPLDKMDQFTLDHAYPELVDYGKVILSTSGNTNPPELARFEIPRCPKFEIYVNGIKQGVFVREGDEAFPMTITPPYTYQKPADITVDFEKADAEGKVDRVNERINYTVKFEDKEQNCKIKIILKGLEGESKREQIMKELLKVVYLESRSAEHYQPSENKRPKEFTNPLEFTLKGKQIADAWEPKWDKLPENVHKDEVKSVYRDFEVTFTYEKPVQKPATKPSPTPRTDPKPNNVQKEVVTVPVCITTEDPNDEKLLGSIRKLKIDLTLLVEYQNKNDYLVTYYGVRGHSDNLETTTIDGKAYSCYVGEIKVPLELWENKWNKQTGKKVDVERSNQKYDLSARFYEGHIIAFAKKASKLAIFWRNWGNVVSAVVILLVGGVIGTVVENCQDFWPNSKVVVAPNAPQEVPDPEVSIGENGSVYINNEIEVTIGENGHWFIDGNDMGRTPNNGNTGDVSHKEDNTDPKANPDPAQKLDDVDYAALDRVAADYMELIRKADMTFAQVDDISGWVAENAAHGNGIKDYNKIKTAIGEYVKCRDLLYKIKKGAGFEKIAKEFHSTVPKIKSNGDYYNLLVNLRVKMQKFTGSNRLNEKGIEEKLYSFAEDHPNGINSFADLPK